MRTSFLLALAALLAAVPAYAQPTIQAGQTVSGRLDASDPRLPDESHYDDYVYRGRPGDRITITLRSGDFDTFLHWGTGQGTGFTALEQDDDGAGGTDSRLAVTVGPEGAHAIRVNSLLGGETGAYTLSIEGAGAGPQPGPAPNPGRGNGTEIQAGQTIQGTLESGDARMGDDSFYDDYVYRGRPGDRITITMRSGDFDTFLHWGTIQGGAFEVIESDDDGAGGTDSRLTVSVDGSGTHAIRANALLGGETGAYTLSVERAGAGPQPQPRPDDRAPAGARTLRPGQSVSGRLTTADPRLGDDSHYQQYLYEGRAGEQLVVTLASSDFDAFLRWGRMDGARYEHLGFDDDGAGGTDARLQVTLDRAGTYAFQANSYAPGQTGSYTLSVQAVQGGGGPGAPTVALGQTVSGRLDTSDPKLPDDSHYDQYQFRGQPGQRVLITLRSSDFDAYLLGGRMAGDQMHADESDDDSGGGTDAQLVATVGPGGVYAFQANSFSAGATGRYTLTVEPVSGGTVAQAPTPAGARTIAAGQTQRGALRPGDPMLSDSSYYHEYLYRGTPGDRIEIVLASSDFDTFLRWGRMTDGSFTPEGSDDDGGGGTNSRLVATVGGTGTYAIHANAFAPGATGAYTLTIRPLGAAAPGGTQAERTSPSSLSGKWMHAYAEPRLQRYRPLGQRMQQGRALEQVVDGLNAQFPMPRNVAVRMDQCGMINAFYSPRDGAITFCYEMVEHLANIFANGSPNWTQEQREAVEGAYTFIMMHEVGHALIHLLDLPITGREEDAVDQLAAVTLIAGGDKGAQAALAGALSLQPGPGARFDDSDYAGEHSLGPQRLYNVMCWIYGSDPRKYAGIVTNGGLPRDRAVRCPGEYDRMSKAWQRILQPHRAN